MNNIFSNIKHMLHFISKDKKENKNFLINLLYYNLSLMIFFQIFLFPSNHSYFKIGIFFWSLMISNYLFFDNGIFICFHKNFSRERLQYDIYEILPYLNISKTKENIQKIFHFMNVITYYIILVKIYCI